ncbi:MAG: phosphatidylethanolamine/phosphatidyl-N-methylethanolamine N-methyltransferase [Bradyrhizobium sp.]|jgi:SAM-dependent methyltransferase|nr:phosphatidylethanolamine/phosphatidyl-N-methylethanolamine N-methyltransferase [Bradyrhizobium sp.]
MTQIQQSPLWSDAEAAHYEQENYGPGLAGWVLKRSHALVEQPFDGSCRFERVIEVGAGSGVHIKYVRHDYGEYVMTDGSDAMLDQMRSAAATARHPDRVIVAKENAIAIRYPDSSFDRLIATHVLEHVPRPHEVILEWARLVKPGGIISVVLPCDPGLLWRTGRLFGPRARAHARGLNYDYVMALEHVNSITNLAAIIGFLFPDRDDKWWPVNLPLSDINLIYVANIRVPRKDST